MFLSQSIGGSTIDINGPNQVSRSYQENKLLKQKKMICMERQTADFRELMSKYYKEQRNNRRGEDVIKKNMHSFFVLRRLEVLKNYGEDLYDYGEIAGDNEMKFQTPAINYNFGKVPKRVDYFKMKRSSAILRHKLLHESSNVLLQKMFKRDSISIMNQSIFVNKAPSLPKLSRNSCVNSTVYHGMINNNLRSNDHSKQDIKPNSKPKKGNLSTKAQDNMNKTRNDILRLKIPLRNLSHDIIKIEKSQSRRDRLLSILNNDSRLDQSKLVTKRFNYLIEHKFAMKPIDKE